MTFGECVILQFKGVPGKRGIVGDRGPIGEKVQRGLLSFGLACGNDLAKFFDFDLIFRGHAGRSGAFWETRSNGTSWSAGNLTNGKNCIFPFLSCVWLTRQPAIRARGIQ